MMHETLRMDRIRFRYRRGPEVLEGLDLSFPSGTTVLLGPNGAGKSTVLSLAAGVITPDRGEIHRWDPVRKKFVSSRSGRAYRTGVAWLPQDFRPLRGLTLNEHVAYSGWLKGMTPREARHAAGEALRKVGLETLAAASVRQLSGGNCGDWGLPARWSTMPD